MSGWPVPRRVIAHERAQRVLVRAGAYGEVVSAWRTRPPLAVVGCYDTGNVGDLALGWTVRRGLRNAGMPGKLLSAGTFAHAPMPDLIAVGGGGLITTHPMSPLARIVATYGTFGPRLALIGVSGELNAAECDAKMLEMLRGASYFSVRSELERRQLSQVVGRDDIERQPDIAFGMAKAFGVEGQRGRDEQTTKVLGVSILPLMMTFRGRRFEEVHTPTDWLRRHHPDLAAVIADVAPRYIAMVTGVVRAYLSRGWRVRFIPFAIEDGALARTLFAGENVEFAPFRANPLTTLREVQGCSVMLATRFHAHVFALLAGVPAISIAYAPKCRELWFELGLPLDTSVAIDDLVRQPEAAIERLTTVDAVTLSRGRIAALEDEAIGALQRAASALSAQSPR